MFAPRVKQLLSTAVVLTALVGGCARSDRMPTAQPSEPKTLLAVAQARASARSPISAEWYTRSNPMGWTGRAHNRFLTEALLRTVNVSSPRERCARLEQVLREGRWLGEDRGRVSYSQRRDWSAQAIAAMPGCRSGREREDYNHNAAFYKARMRSLAEVTPYTDAIMAAVNVATSSTQLASTIAVITDSASAVLSGEDLDIVNAAGSFTVSSAQYWEANGDWQVEALATGGMGACIEQTLSAEACVYASRGPRRQQGPTFRLASVRSIGGVTNAAGAPFCPYRWNGWAVTAGDLGGFMGGLMTVSVGGGVFVGAAASVGAFVGEAGRELYCRVTHQQ